MYFFTMFLVRYLRCSKSRLYGGGIKSFNTKDNTQGARGEVDYCRVDMNILMMKFKCRPRSFTGAEFYFIKDGVVLEF
jgi:hypothetical protein